MLNEEETAAPKFPSFFPSFVECVPARATDEAPEVISHWNPKRSGVDLLDAKQGVRYFAEALAFCREIRAPYFLVCVLKEMRFDQIGSLERAFLNELASKATVGGRSLEMSAQEASSLIALHGTDLETIRGVEASVREFIETANLRRRPDALSCLMADWLRAQDNWVSEAVAIAICVAAMKGALH